MVSWKRESADIRQVFSGNAFSTEFGSGVGKRQIECSAGETFFSLSQISLFGVLSQLCIGALEVAKLPGL